MIDARIDDITEADLDSGTSVPLEIRSPLAEFWRRLLRQRVALVAGLLILVVIVAAVAAPWIAPFDPAEPDYENVLAGPSALHWAGTDAYGRDIFSRIIWGARISISVGFLSVALGGVLGVTLGLVSGYFGGWVDNLVMRLCDVMLAFPGILLAIAVVALLGPGVANVIYAVAVFSIPIYARVVRGSTLAVKQTLYVQAARSIGVKGLKLVLRHILPGTLPGIIVTTSLRMGTAILVAAGLSFLGLGAQPPSPEWGAMLADGRSYLGVADHLTFFPGLAIFLIVLAFNLLGDGLRDALDQKLRP
ncbi:ABC transporter permease subunit [Pseudoroseomonas wenyumeiae]|uniref:Glutathione transport system permease protein GsiD n=1 Tax=Teichococcus wenyumeiae TaxID=2478470 RepID=A0A3A9JJ87_9PROT|nr:ABC transporter permease subunit [Pseudoroseomonas wenyumeiae]RKK04833.1 ABC transporter permease subunit [Pseudoroseomonas wenyumeiae]RMI20532.1 ABC transporter permease subunit [Pseudoroseomonas wenyumeiae]